MLYTLHFKEQVSILLNKMNSDQIDPVSFPPFKDFFNLKLRQFFGNKKSEMYLKLHFTCVLLENFNNKEPKHQLYIVI